MKQVDGLNAQKLLGSKRPGEFEVLDVRQDWEYSEMHLPGAKLIPLGELPDRIEELDADRPVLVYCRTGTRSQAAARFLEGQGFSDVSNLNGGIMSWMGVASEGDPDSGMIHFPDIATLGDIYRFGYGMERSLHEFYTSLAEQAATAEVRALFEQLAGFEDKHMQALYILYSQVSAEPQPRDAFARLAVGEFAEGGLDPNAYLARRAGVFTDSREALELAMSIEAQALDYYMRCARRSGPGETADAFMRLAREEQGHLRLLTNRYDRIS